MGQHPSLYSQRIPEEKETNRSEIRLEMKSESYQETAQSRHAVDRTVNRALCGMETALCMVNRAIDHALCRANLAILDDRPGGRSGLLLLSNSSQVVDRSLTLVHAFVHGRLTRPLSLAVSDLHSALFSALSSPMSKKTLLIKFYTLSPQFSTSVKISQI